MYISDNYTDPVVMEIDVRYILSAWQWDIFEIFSLSSLRESDISHCCDNMAGYTPIIFHFWALACMTSSLCYM